MIRFKIFYEVYDIDCLVDVVVLCHFWSCSHLINIWLWLLYFGCAVDVVSVFVCVMVSLI